MRANNGIGTGPIAPTIGNLRHRVTVQVRQPSTPDAYGNITPNWRNLITVPAQVLPESASELALSLQSQASTRYRVLIRYLSLLETRHRLLWDGHILDVDGITDIEGRKRFQEVRCKESA